MTNELIIPPTKNQTSSIMYTINNFWSHPQALVVLK
jgi:hypothetical protein